MASTIATGVTMGPFVGGLVAEINWRLAFILVSSLDGDRGILLVLLQRS